MEVVDCPRNWRNTAELRWTGNRLSVYCSTTDISGVGIAAQLRGIPTESSTGHYLRSQFLRVAAAAELSSEVVKAAAVLVANDLSGVIAALNSLDNRRVPVVYDAQEIFTDSYDLLPGEPLTGAEKTAWLNIESEVVLTVDQVVTVSPGIAELYLERHGRRPTVVPNFVPREMFRGGNDSGDSLPTRFVFLGRADPHRGLEHLVEQWDFDPAVATLDMFVPNSASMKNLVRHSEGVRRRFVGPVFRNAVKPANIVETLSGYDIGVLPYAYPPPYDNASPNKFGEYVAAGLPVIANRQPFTAELIDGLEIGRVFDWSIDGDFRAAVTESLNLHTRSEWHRNMHLQREARLAWDAYLDSVWSDVSASPVSTASADIRDLMKDFEVTGAITVAAVSTLRRLTLTFARRNVHRLSPLIRMFGRWGLVRRLLP